jgi:hypothetical protein
MRIAGVRMTTFVAAPTRQRGLSSVSLITSKETVLDMGCMPLIRCCSIGHLFMQDAQGINLLKFTHLYLIREILSKP